MIDASDVQRFGLLSDSHGHVERTRAAVERLRSAGAEFFIHLGDLGTESVIDVLAGERAAITLGNCDWPSDPLQDYAAFLDIAVLHPAGTITCNGFDIWITHGHLPDAIAAGLKAGVRYLAHGHTHEVEDSRHGATRILNPGALTRADRYTVGILDVSEDTWSILDV